VPRLWEVLLLAGIVLLLIRQTIRGRITLRFGPWLGVPALMALLAAAFALGLLHTQYGPLGYGLTGTKRPLIAFMTPLYLFLTYVIVINSIQRRRQLWQIMRWLDWLTVGLIVFGLTRLILMLTGAITGMWFFGLPVVLYDQMLMLYVPIFTLMALFFHRQRLEWWRGIMLALMVFLILCSTRRFNYLLLAMGVVLILAIGVRLRLWRPRQLVRAGLAGGIALAATVAVILVATPRLASGVGTSLRTLDLMSRLGQKYSGDMRLAEIRNLFANLDERPYGYLTGFGLGTLWHARERQPVDPLTRRLRPNRKWYTQFHLPYIAILFRLGFVGTALLLLWLWHYARHLLPRIRRLQWPIRHSALAMFAFLILILPSLTDSFNPTAWTLCGLYIGLLEKMARLAGGRHAVASDIQRYSNTGKGRDHSDKLGKEHDLKS